MASPWEKAQRQQSTGAQALGYARSAVEGMTFGWGDEIGLSIAALAAKASGAEASIGDIYDEMRLGYVEDQSQFREDNPVSSTAVEIAGGLATGGGAAKLFSRYAPAAAARVAQIPGVLRYPGAGVGAGAVAGAGFAEEDRLEGAKTGAIVGGVTGGATAAAGGIASGIARKAFARQDTKALRRVAAELQRDGLTPKQIGARLRRLGPDAMIADVGGANVKGLAETVAQSPGPGAQRAVRSLTRRQARSSRNNQALRGAADDIMPNSPDYFEALEGLAQKRSSEAGPLYERILDRPVSQSEALEALSQRPVIKAALRRARTRLADEGLDPDAQTLRAWQYAKEHLGGLEGQAVRAGNGTRARTLGNARRALVEKLDEQIPEFADARKAYEAPSRLSERMKAGRDALKGEPDEIRRLVKSLDQEEAQFFRAGVYRGLMDMLDDFSTNRDPRQLLVKPKMRARLTEVFGGDKSALRRFERAVRNQSAKKQTQNQMLGNSATARRLARADDAGVDPNIAAALVTQEPISAGAAVVRQVVNKMRKKGLSDRESEELGRILFSMAPRDRADILARLSSPSIALPARVPGYSAGAASEAAALSVER